MEIIKSSLRHSGLRKLLIDLFHLFEVILQFITTGKAKRGISKPGIDEKGCFIEKDCLFIFFGVEIIIRPL
ncbi:MAG: hypothetical protein WA066_02395 [Candidatus Omnitrophota bacterium]